MKYPATVSFRSDKVDLVVEANGEREAIDKARSKGMEVLPSFGGDDIGMSIKVHLKRPID